jgi:hypothetical protein
MTHVIWRATSYPPVLLNLLSGATMLEMEVVGTALRVT